MDKPGIYPLAALQVTPDMDLALLTPQPDLGGMTAVSLALDFRYGSGGTSALVVVATTLDGGVTWWTIKRWELGVVSRRAYVNLEGLLSIDVAAYTDLLTTPGEGKNDGLLGDRLAVFLQSVGNYANTTLSVRASVR